MSILLIILSVLISILTVENFGHFIGLCIDSRFKTIQTKVTEGLAIDRLFLYVNMVSLFTTVWWFGFLFYPWNKKK